MVIQRLSFTTSELIANIDAGYTIFPTYAVAPEILNEVKLHYSKQGRFIEINRETGIENLNKFDKYVVNLATNDLV